MPYAPAIISCLTSTEMSEQEGKKQSLLSTSLRLHGLSERQMQGNQNEFRRETAFYIFGH